MTESVNGLRAALVPYVDMLRSFVLGRLSFPQLEPLFNDTFHADTTAVTHEAWVELEGFFEAVDSCYEDPADRDPKFREIGPDELRDDAIRLLRRGGYEI